MVGKFLSIPNCMLLMSLKSLLSSPGKQKTITQHAHQDRLNNWRHLLRLFLTFSYLDHASSFLLNLGQCPEFVLFFAWMFFAYSHPFFSNVRVTIGMIVSHTNLKTFFISCIIVPWEYLMLEGTVFIAHRVSMPLFGHRPSLTTIHVPRVRLPVSSTSHLSQGGCAINLKIIPSQ